MIRLDKLLAHLGYGSRKDVKNLIRKGNVYVNDVLIKDDDFKVDEEKDEVIIDGLILDYSKYVYYMLNKPSGYVSATEDPKEKTVIDLIIEPMKGIFPVGRLDKDSEGLLLITNDGKLAHNLLSPKKHVDKLYYVEYEGELPNNIIEIFNEGVVLEDGYKCLPAKIELLENNRAHVTIKEGKFHQVKRMFLVNNSKVTYLKRIAFGSLILDSNLELGESRPLTNEELEDLKNH